jgi:hypothetical protein
MTTSFEKPVESVGTPTPYVKLEEDQPMSPRFAFTPLPVTRSEQRKPFALAGLCGLWRGEMIDERGYAQAFTLLRDASNDVAVTGRFLFFVSGDVSPTGVKLLEAANASFVALIGPYYMPEEGTNVLTVLEGVRKDAEISGRFHTRLPGRRDSIRCGRFHAHRADEHHKAA